MDQPTETPASDVKNLEADLIEAKKALHLERETVARLAHQFELISIEAGDAEHRRKVALARLEAGRARRNKAERALDDLRLRQINLELPGGGREQLDTIAHKTAAEALARVGGEVVREVVVSSPSLAEDSKDQTAHIPKTVDLSMELQTDQEGALALARHALEGARFVAPQTTPDPEALVAEGFAFWTGGERPVAEWDRVEVVLRSGYRNILSARMVRWTEGAPDAKLGSALDVIAWRPAPVEPVAAADDRSGDAA